MEVVNPDLGYVYSLAAFPNGNLVSGHNQGYTCIYDRSQPDIKMTFHQQHKDRVTSVATLSDDCFISGSWDGTIQIWSLSSKKIRVLPLPEGHVYAVAGINEKWVAGGTDVGLYVHHLASNECDVFDDGEAISALALYTNKLVVGYRSGKIKLWDFEKKASRLIAMEVGAINSIYVINDTIIVGTDHGISSFSLLHQKDLLRLRVDPHGVLAVIQLPDGRVVAGSYDPMVRVYNLEEVQVNLKPGHSNVVTSIVLISDNLIASGSWDGSVRLWPV